MSRSTAINPQNCAALDAAAARPVQALLTTGPVMDAVELGAIPANVTVEAWVPQAEALSYTTAVVCHGGLGTLSGGLAMEAPIVVASLFADQPVNARRMGTRMGLDGDCRCNMSKPERPLD